MKVLRIFYKMSRLVWRFTKPITLGVRVIMIQGDKVLLVKHTYQDSWYLPGGGMKKGETFEQAIRREAQEEIGAELNSLRLFGAYNNFYEYKNDNILVFLSDDFSLKGSTDREIESFEFFSPQSLPVNTSPGTRKRIQEYIEGSIPKTGMW